MSPDIRSTAVMAPVAIDRSRFGLVHGLGVALLLHLLMLLITVAVPDLFAVPVNLIPEPDRPDPIKFTFVDVADSHVVEKNPDAELLSDKSRKESGQTPKVTTPEGKEPPSEGNTRQRVDAVAVAEIHAERGQEGEQLPRTPSRPPQPVRKPVPENRDTEEERLEDSERQANQRAREEAEERAAAAERIADAARQAQAAQRADEERKAPSAEQARQDRLNRALDSLAARPLPTDMKAFKPPTEESVPRVTGKTTRWRFDNPNPSFPVKVGSLSFDSKGADFGPWLREFHARVLSEWSRNLNDWHERRWRELAGSRQISGEEASYRYARMINSTRGVTGVDFVVTREGFVVDLDMVHPSGYHELDQTVHRTLRNVLLPPLPDDYPDESLLIRAGFYYNVEPPE